MFPYISNEVVNCSDTEISSLFKDLYRDAIRARGIVILQLSDCSQDFTEGWWTIQFFYGWVAWQLLQYCQIRRGRLV